MYYGFEFSADGTLLAVLMCEPAEPYQCRIKIFDTKTYNLFQEIISDERFYDIEFSSAPENITIINGLSIWDVTNGRLVRRIEHDNSIAINYKQALSPDGKILVLIMENHQLMLFDIETGETIATLKGHDAEITDILFSETGDSIISTSVDGKVILWGVKSVGE